MNTIQSGRFDLGYHDQPPILIGANSETAMARAVTSIEASGRRIGATMTLHSARERIERQISASTIWIEVDDSCGSEIDCVLDTIVANVAMGRVAAVVSASCELIDPICARLGEAEVELIIDAGEAERAAALAIATARISAAPVLSDIASDQNAERLRQLSDEVSRIASTLARLSTGPGPGLSKPEPRPTAAVPEISADAVRTVIRARRLRTRYFPEHLFADPAWDMLLDLLQAEIAQLRVPVSSLCIAAAVPATTALRWLKTLVQEGLFVRRADPHDGRRVFVELAPETSRAMRRYFAEVGSIAPI